MEYRPKLRQNYSGIKRLKYYEPNRRRSFTEIIDWSIWNFLSHLEIRFHCQSDIVLEDVFTSLSGSPHLIHLTLLHQYLLESSDIRNTVSWLDIELLHLKAPLLEYLNIDFAHIKISNYEVNNIRHVLPARTVTKAIFDNDKIDTSWVFYFALKYPNLHHLEFKNNGTIYGTREAYYEKTYEKDIRLLSTLDQFFPCLKNISLDPLNYNSWPFSIFYDTLRHFGVNVERAKIRVIHWDRAWTRSLHSCTEFSPKSLRVLWADFGHESVNPAYKGQIPSILPLYPCLVELHFMVVGGIEIDVMLDKCPSLRLLDIHFSSVRISEKPNHNPHPLQRLNLHNLRTATPIFKYLSFRCKQLLFMKLEHVEFEISESTKNREIFIEMPYTQLDTLILYSIGTYRGFVKHFVIKQEDNIDVSQLDLTNQQQPIRSSWYHICKGETKHFAWELGKREVEYAQRFFQDVTNFDSDENKIMGYSNISYSSSLKKDWKSDLKYGYFSLRVKSVKGYHLDKEELLEKSYSLPIMYLPSVQ
ncbi:hypothetical protein F4703DRAFT_1885640 [Phycomyces blakesleeanus]